MAVKTSWAAGDVLLAADLTDTFAAKADLASPAFTGQPSVASANSGSGLILSPHTGSLTTSTPVFLTTPTASEGAAFRNQSGNLMFFTGSIPNSNIGTERFRISPDGTLVGTGPSLGSWTSFALTISGTGWALGDSVVVAKYATMGKIVFARFHIVWGATATFGAAADLLIGAPTAVVNSYREPVGRGLAEDVSAASGFPFILQPDTSPWMKAVVVATSAVYGTNTAIRQGTPATFAPGDIFGGSYVYERT